MVFSAFVKVRNFGLGPHADQSDEMYRYFYRYFCWTQLKSAGVFLLLLRVYCSIKKFQKIIHPCSALLINWVGPHEACGGQGGHQHGGAEREEEEQKSWLSQKNFFTLTQFVLFDFHFLISPVDIFIC